MDKGAILLKDHVGETSESTLGMIKRLVGGKSAVVNILRGELVEPIPGYELAPRIEGQKPYNYRWKKDPAFLLYCHGYDIAPLSDKEFLLLEAIHTPAPRYEVFISGEKLDWGCNLKPGDIVYVNIPSLTVLPIQPAAAVIRYVGGLPPQPGLMFGIEIMDKHCRGNGTTDGTFLGLRYFRCEDNCGLFVALDKLSPDHQGSSLIKEPRGGKSYAKVSSHGPPHSVQSHQPDNTSPADNTRSRSHLVSRPGGKESCINLPPHPHHFEKGDRVVAFTKKGVHVHGTVRWVGRNVTSRKFTITVVGIETDVAVSGSDFENCIPGMTYLFAATKNHHLFLPETTILSEVEATTGANDGQRNKAHPPENIDVEDTAALAREMGVSTATLLENQKAALREAKLTKEAQEIKQLKQATGTNDGQQDQPHQHEQSSDHSGAQVPVAYGPPPQQGVQFGELDVGSLVQISDPPQYGVIRWIGELPNIQGYVAGVELDEYMDGCTDGTWQERRYFTCPYGRGFFIPYYSLSPDRRFDTSGNTFGAAHYDSSTKNHLPKEEERTQLKKETYEIKEDLQEKCAKLQTQLSQAQHEKQDFQERYTHLEERLQQQKQQHSRLEEQLRQERQEMAQLSQEAAQERQETVRLKQEGAKERQQTAQLRQEMAQLRQEAAEVKQQLEHQLQELIADNQRLQQPVADSQAGAQQTRLIQLQSTLEAIEYWKVPRRDIQVIREVGVGAWGSVSEGKYKDQLVAVKQPHRAILTTPIVKRLQREIQIMAQVRHPNLVRFIAAVFDDKVQRLEEPPMIILELLDMNLRTAYEKDVLGASKIPIFRDVAYALHYLHEHQDPIIHRDISTPNVLLEALPQGAWKAKVSDFGSANLEKRSKTAGEGAIIYSAPETFPHTDPTTLPPPQTTKIDVFSYGILLCEVITRQLPEDPTIYRQMLQQVKTQWLFMYDLIVSCTKRDPNERPTMAQVLDKLNKLPRPRPRVRQHS